MESIPYNIPEVAGGVIDLYCKYTSTVPIPGSGYPATFRHSPPGVSVRAGTLVSISADKSWNVDSSLALRIKLASTGTGTTYEICQCYREHFSLTDTIEVTAVTSDVYDDDDNLVLRGGTFHYTFACVVYDKDSPYSQTAHFLEYRLGEEVHEVITGTPQAYALREMNYGAGGGIASESSPEFPGRVLANADGHASGLEITAIRDHGGVLLAGTASRPGLYWFQVWMQSYAATPHGTGEGANAKEFEGGDNSEMFIVSIRPRSPVEGDLVCLVDAPIAAVDKNTFQVIHAEITNTDGFQDHIESSAPDDTWEYHSGVWDEPEVWTQTPSAPASSTGNTHLAGYWTRTHTEAITGGALRWWYVITRDDDGYWRLYCALDTNVTYSWFEMARVSALGLTAETPPKYWPSIRLCAKGAEHYVVDGKGVFSWAGYYDLGTAPDTVTVEVFGQQPLYTPRYRGWTAYLPPELRHHDNELLYRHPEYGWVCVPTLATELTAGNAAEYQCDPQAPGKVALPFAPVRPPQSRGGLTYARDIALMEGGAAPMFGRSGVAGALALLARADGHAIADAIWWRYPLFRFWNMERMRMTVEVEFSVTTRGGPVTVDSFEDMTTFWQRDVISGMNPWSDDPDDYPYPGYRYREKSRNLDRGAADVNGSYSATCRVENIPCWVNDFFLIARVAGGTAATSASASVHGIAGVVSSENSRTESVYGDKDFEAGTVNVVEAYYSDKACTVEYGDSFDGSNPAAKCSASVGVSLGSGCDTFICPVVRRGDMDRPRQMRIFAASFGASCDWELTGSGESDSETYTEYSWIERDHGTEVVHPQPADVPGTPFQQTINESCSASWESGLVAWGDGGTIRADHTEILANVWKSAEYYLVASETSENWSAARHSELDVSYSHVTGRTTWGEAAAGTATKYPLVEITARASRVDHDNAANNASVAEYDAATGTIRSAQEVIDAYDRYAEWVDEIESPTLGDLDFDHYPGLDQDGVGKFLELDQSGRRTESRREKHVGMTITITDADPVASAIA